MTSLKMLILAACAAVTGSALAAPPNATDAEVRKVDAAQGKLTLRHGPMAHLDMPAMTMVFKVKEPRWLDGLKAGDRLTVVVDKVDGAYTVTHLEPAPR